MRGKHRSVVGMSLLVSVGVLLCATRGAAAQQAPTVAQWKEDVRFLAAELPKRHPNLFHSVSAERFQREASALEARVGEMAPHEILIEMARLTATVGEIHTGVALHRQPRQLLEALHAFPVRFHLFADGLFVQAIDTTHRGLVGARVVSIGGQPWQEAVRSMSAIVVTDNIMGRAKFAPVYLSIAEGLHALKIIPTLTALDLVVEPRGGSPTRIRLSARPLVDLLPLLDTEGDPVSLAGFVNIRESAIRPVPLWLQEAGNRYWFRFLPESGTAYVRIDVMRDKPEESLSGFYKRVLGTVDTLLVKRLVIDLRRNNGGDNIALSLVEGLIARPALNQRGKVFVLVGRGTVSSGQNLATLLQRYTNAVFIGEPTGQRPNHYGVMARFSLPNSRVSVTHSRFLLVDSDPEDLRPWLSPDIDARLTSRDYATNRDPAFEAALSFNPQAALPPLAEVLADAYLPGFWMDSIVDRYQALRARFASARYQADTELVKLGHNLLAWGRPDHALKVFELAIASDPDSYRAHAGHGTALKLSGQAERARAAQVRAAELNPWMERK